MMSNAVCLVTLYSCDSSIFVFACIMYSICALVNCCLPYSDAKWLRRYCFVSKKVETGFEPGSVAGYGMICSLTASTNLRSSGSGAMHPTQKVTDPNPQLRQLTIISDRKYRKHNNILRFADRNVWSALFSISLRTFLTEKRHRRRNFRWVIPFI